MPTQRLELPRLFIKYQIKNGDNDQLRVVSIPVKFSTKRTMGIAVKFWRYGRMTTSPASMQLYLKLNDEMPKIPTGYKWAFEKMTVTPQEFGEYVKKAIDIVERMCGGEVLQAYLKRL